MALAQTPRPEAARTGGPWVTEGGGRALLPPFWIGLALRLSTLPVHSFVHSFTEAFMEHLPCARPGTESSGRAHRPSQPGLAPASALQTLITAVGQTAYTVASVIILLFVLMFIFGILGFCLFGVPDKGDLNNWGNLAVAFFTLFSLATVPCLGTVVGTGALRRAWQPVWVRGQAGPHVGSSSCSGS